MNNEKTTAGSHVFFWFLVFTAVINMVAFGFVVMSVFTDNAHFVHNLPIFLPAIATFGGFTIAVLWAREEYRKIKNTSENI